MERVMAEDRAQPLPEPKILRLSGYPLLTQQAAIENNLKYLRLGKYDGGHSEMSAPFEKVLKFPVVGIFYSDDQKSVLPSNYLLSRLTYNFHYVEWDLAVVTDLQLTEYPGYILHVGDATGAPTRARWGIRKTGAGAYEDFPVEHVLEYLNTNNEWIRVFSRKMRWTHEGDQEPWGGGSIDHYDDIYWEEIQTPKIDNLSPLVDGIAPYPDKSVDENNIGTIEDILINREAELGSAYDFVSGLRVFGAVTRVLLTLSDATPIPNRHFNIEHDMGGVSHLIEDGIYTAIGIGTVISKVTDYENDATIFNQDVIVSTKGKPEVNIYRAGTDTLYQMEWMSNDESADEWRRKGLDLEANSTINGTYDLVTRVATSEAKRETVTKDSEEERVASERIYGHTDEDTSEEGIAVTSIAYLVGDYGQPISAESDAKYMRFDSTIPTISKVDFDGEWESWTGHDAKDDLSGLNKESGGVHYLFVKREEGVAPKEIDTPVDGKDWESLINNYKLPSEAGEYDLYVYAKDDATNRSKALPLNKEPIIVYGQSSAKVRLEKKVVDDEGNNTDIFVIHLEANSVMLGSVALRRNEISGWMSLDMSEEEFRKIKVTEVVPMDYAKGYRIRTTDGDGNTILLDEGEDEITLKASDEITITIENEFEHAGYFRDKVAVKNIFRQSN